MDVIEKLTLFADNGFNFKFIPLYLIMCIIAKV